MARHLARMAELGLLQRIRRLVRRPWPEGGRGAVRVEQTSNAYLVLFPARVVTARSQRSAPRNTGCHLGSGEADRRSTPAPAMDRTAALAALEAVRMAREAVVMARWLARR